MSLSRRKDGRWCRTKTINGERIYFYSTESTEKKALRDIESQMIAYKGKIERGKTFQEVADEWEEVHYKTVQYQTASRYKSHVARAVDRFGTCYIKKITSDEILCFYQSLALQGFSTKSIKDQASIVKLIMRYARIKGYTSVNTADYVSAPAGTPKIERTPLTADEICAVENGISLEFGKLAYFLLYTGLRKGEALALTYADVNLKESTILVNKSVEYISNTPRIKEPKTKAGIRIVPLPEALKFMFSGKHTKTEIVFSQNGQLMKKSYFREHWLKYCQELGIDATPHQFRHTYATFLFEWDISEKDAQHILGHADISTTQNIYTHITENRIKKTTDSINRKMGCHGVVNQ